MNENPRYLYEIEIAIPVPKDPLGMMFSLGEPRNETQQLFEYKYIVKNFKSIQIMQRSVRAWQFYSSLERALLRIGLHH